jgi:universal stress protein A
MKLSIGSILVPTDFSECSNAAMEYAVHFARELGAELELLHVWEAPYYLLQDAMLSLPGQAPQPLGRYARDLAHREMERLVTKLREQTGLKVQGGVESGPAAQLIVQVARESAHDLIVMGTHGRSGWKHLWTGSVAEKVVRGAPCPVLTIRHPDEPAADLVTAPTH